MTLLQNTFAGGAAGTTLTPGAGGNTGGASGSFMSAVTIDSGGGLVQFAGTRVAAGSAQSCLCITGAGTQGSFIAWAAPSLPPLTQSWGRYYGQLLAPVVTNDAVVEFMGSEGFGGGLQLTTTGQIVVQDAGFATLYTSTAVVTAGQPFRIEWQLTNSASAGLMAFQLYLSPESVTPTESYNSGLAQNTGPNLTQVGFGWNNGHANQPGLLLGAIAVSSTGPLGPYVPPAPPAAGRLAAAPDDGGRLARHLRRRSWL